MLLSCCSFFSFFFSIARKTTDDREQGKCVLILFTFIFHDIYLHRLLITSWDFLTFFTTSRRSSWIEYIWSIAGEESKRQTQDTKKLIIFLQLHLQSRDPFQSYQTGFCCCSVRCGLYTTFNFQFHNFFSFFPLPSLFYVCLSEWINCYRFT